MRSNYVIVITFPLYLVIFRGICQTPAAGFLAVLQAANDMLHRSVGVPASVVYGTGHVRR
jgi:hypothetical protein